MKHIVFITTVVAMLVVGCAGNQGVSSKVSELETVNQKQEQEIVTLKRQLAEKEAANKWDWKNVWSNESDNVRKRVTKCWEDLSK